MTSQKLTLVRIVALASVLASSVHAVAHEVAPGFPHPEAPVAPPFPQPDAPVAPPFPQPDAPVAPGFPTPIWEKAPISMELQHSSLCLDISEGGVASPFTQQRCQELVARQDFKFLPAGEGTYMIQNVQSKMCLDIEGGSTEQGARLISYPCTGTDNQRFYVNPTSQTTATITVRHSGLCVDLLGGQVGRNEVLGQWACTGEKNQEIRFIY